MMGFRSNFAACMLLLMCLSASLLFVLLNLADLSASPTSKPKAKPKYPSGIPDKFDLDGNVQHFPGNTIISHLSNSSQLYISLLALYNRLEQSPLSHLYTLLPPSSWHMTILNGVDKSRKPGYWPSNLAIDATLEECTALFKQELLSFELQTNLPYHLSVAGLSNSKSGLSLHIEPHPADNTALRDLRDRLAGVLQIRHPDHDHYGFHISVAYLLRFLTREQRLDIEDLIADHLRDTTKDFDLGSPELCTFEDMLAYEPVLYLDGSVE